MNIKSDASTEFKTEEVNKSKNKLFVSPTIFWSLTLIFGGTMMWLALTHPSINGLIAVIVFIIGLNRVDAAIDYFKLNGG